MTSLTGESVTIYPMPVWLDARRKAGQDALHASRHGSSISTASTTSARSPRSTAGPRGDPSAAARGGRHDRRGRRVRRSTTSSTSGTTSGSSRSCSASRTPTTTRGRCRSSGSDAHVRTPARTGDGRRTVTLLAPSRGGLFVDCTVGLGGHARALLEAGASRVIGLDRDPDGAAARGASRSPGSAIASSWCTPTIATWRACSTSAAFAGIDGALADLGVSSMQLDAEGRGFSFRRDEPLDMRMDRSQGPTAADLIATADEESLAERDLPVRRRALLAADRAGDRRRARSSTPISDDGAAGADRPARDPAARLPADRSGDAHVPGAADLGQPRARRARRASSRRPRSGCSAARGWP